MNKYTSAMLVAVALAGCTTTSTGAVTEIGPDTYLLAGTGGTMEHASSSVKAKLIDQGKKYCADKGRSFVMVNSSGQDAGLNYSSAEIQFRCTASQ